jgi:DNA-binding NarL/FixJ family response regulator
MKSSEMPQGQTLRVAIVASGLATRVGLRALLMFPGEIEICAEAARIADLEWPLADLDVLVLAVEAGGFADFEDGLAALETQPALLVLTDDTSWVRRLSDWMRAAWGVLTTDASQEDLLIAVKALHTGLLVADPVLMRRFEANPFAAPTSQNEEGEEALTEREDQVLHLVAQGLANKQIAIRLGISAHTVKFHISSIYAKLGATNRAEAIRAGLLKGKIAL